MGHKVFVSYKYADSCVKDFNGNNKTTVRDYVDELERLLDEHIYKGEQDGEDLSELSEDTIRKHLSDRLFDSTVTIVCISPKMKDIFKPEKEQWIPWEVSYSLRNTTRQGRSSLPNGAIALVLPDKSGAYEYYLEGHKCCTSSCTTHKTNTLFKIIRENKFNKINGNNRICSAGDTIWTGESSYIEAVRWADFVKNPDCYIEKALDRRNRIDEFDIKKNVY